MLASWEQNIQWIFSGIGVLAVSGLVWWMRQILQRRKGVLAEPPVPLSLRKPEARTAKYFSAQEMVDVGSYVDLPSQGMRPVRISILGLEDDQGHARVRLAVNNGGGVFCAGTLCRKGQVNEFSVPQFGSQYGGQEDFSVYRHFAHDGRAFFFRVYVTHVDAHANRVELDLIELSVW